MWPIATVERELVSILFSCDAVVCCWIQKTKNGMAPLVLRAYKRYQLTNLELEHLIIFNPTIIKEYIVSFLQEHDLCNAFVVFSVDGPNVTENFIPMPTSTPHRNDFALPELRNLLWEYRYLYAADHGQCIFYTYAISRSLVLQYQLLAISAQCNLIVMTTKNMALLDFYKNIFGTAFRRSQLAVDMMRCNNNINDLVSADTLKRMVDLSGCSVEQKDYIPIAAACGLFCAERIEK